MPVVVVVVVVVVYMGEIGVCSPIPLGREVVVREGGGLEWLDITVLETVGLDR